MWMPTDRLRMKRTDGLLTLDWVSLGRVVRQSAARALASRAEERVEAPVPDEDTPDIAVRDHGVELP
ncbi:MAG: hypothetical protein PVI86_05230 [Phycisphaerae bacterium]|jgi:hypothetical protein